MLLLKLRVRFPVLLIFSTHPSNALVRLRVHLALIKSTTSPVLIFHLGEGYRHLTSWTGALIVLLS